jgi:hypothetical protein
VKAARCCPSCSAFPGQTSRPPQVGDDAATSCFDNWHFLTPAERRGIPTITIREEIAS